jgi:hypothetical protein
MVVYILYVKADLEHIQSLQLVPGASLCLSVRNPVSGESREKIVIDASALEEPAVTSFAATKATGTKHHEDRHHPKHADPPCHFALKWEGASARSTIRVLEKVDYEKKLAKLRRDQLPVEAMKAGDSGSFVPMLALECQDIEPYAFHPMGEEFEAINTASVQFDTVDLSGGDWSHYDLATGTTSIKNLETKFK